MELEEHFQPEEPRDGETPDVREAGEGPAWVDAYEF